MKTFDSFYRLHRLLKRSRHPVPMARIQAELECSRATAHRLITHLRDRMDAPIESTRDPYGYRYTDANFELPGLWFNAVELQSLLVLQQLLAGFGTGVLDAELAPLRSRLDGILRTQGLKSGQAHRVRLLRALSRSPGEHLGTVASAVWERKRLSITYAQRDKPRAQKRLLSPQRLTLYRDNWYLDAWCHHLRGLRTFALDCVRSAQVLDTPAQDIDDATLDAELSGAYGIFAGRATQEAVLRFSPRRAPWVAAEQWHPGQVGKWLEDGSYELRVPFHRQEELVMDVMRYGDEVEVVGPAGLREEVAGRLGRAVARYGRGG